MHQEQGAGGARRLIDDAGVVVERGALRLGQLASGNAMAPWRQAAPHGGDHVAVGLAVVDRRQPERHGEAPEERDAGCPAQGQVIFPDDMNPAGAQRNREDQKQDMQRRDMSPESRADACRNAGGPASEVGNPEQPRREAQQRGAP